ncbi:MAG: LytR family transcriptional regulator [Anaerolineales bacterium]|nr:MAG: LytR family transcriptional regulator [Anaerolineales bacterium]
MKRPERTSSKRNFPAWLIRVLAGGFVLAGLLSAYLLFVNVRNLAAAWSGTGLPSFQISRSTEGGNGATPTITVLEQLPDLWDGNERVTILVMGLDYRDWERGDGPSRTDSMMLVTIDPLSRTAGMLSLPRDLWVEIPGYGHGRINTAYFLGEQDRLPGGGPELAVRTVEKFMGVPIQYYVQIDFSAFEKMVDEIGGVELTVYEEIYIDPIGKDNTVKLKPGNYRFDGELTLAYARVRYTEGGDFDRATRQQQVAMAIRDQVLEMSNLPGLLASVPALYQDLTEGIRTNLAVDQMIALGMLALQISPENVARAVIAPPEMVTFETVIYGGEEAKVLKPVPDKIRLLRDEVFTATGAIGPSVAAETPQDAAKLEAANLAVLNGAGEEGLAGLFSEALTGLGFNVTQIANADRLDYPTTRIIDYTGKPYTVQYLVDLLDLTQSQVLFQNLPGSEVDVALVIGYDWSGLLSKLSD